MTNEKCVKIEIKMETNASQFTTKDLNLVDSNAFFIKGDDGFN